METIRMSDIKREAQLPEIKNIFQKMLDVEDELKTVGKNLDVKTGHNSSYRAVSERDIIDAVKPLEKKHGIYSYPVVREIVSSDTLEREGKNGKRLEFFMRIKTVYRFVNVENPEEYVEMTSYADGIDSGDKATGKAMTYADKYALMKAYKISTGDDPDQEASKEYTSSKNHQEEITLLTSEWSRLRNEMERKGIDFRSEKVDSWIKNYLQNNGYAPSHDACDDVGQMRMINKLYSTLIKSKHE